MKTISNSPVALTALSTTTRKAGRPKEYRALVADDREAWDRQSGETLLAYEAFQTYRHLGPGRTLEKAAAKLGKHPSTMANWSSRWCWPARIKELNLHLAEDSVAEMQEHQRVALERQRVQGEALQEAAFDQLLDQLRAGGVWGKDLVPLVLGIRKDMRAVLGYADPTGPRAGAPGVQVNVNVATDQRLQQFAHVVAGWAQSAGLSDDQLAGLVAALGTVE